MTDQQRETFSGIQSLRALAAFLVVLQHSYLAIKTLDNNYWIESQPQSYPAFLSHLGAGVDIFFCISGFIMFMLLDTRRSDSGLQFLTQRALRIFPPYWAFTLLSIAVFYVSAGLYNDAKLTGDFGADLSRIALSMLLLPQPGSPILGIGWTLIIEMLFYAICAAAIALRWARHLDRILLAVGIAGVILSLARVEVLFGYFLSPAYLEFWLGAVAYRYRDKLTRIAPGAQVLCAIVLFFLASHIIENVETGLPPTLLRVLGFGPMAFMLVNGVNGLYRRHKLGAHPVFHFTQKVGDASYLLYLSHWFVLSAAGKLIARAADLPAPMVAVWHASAIAAAVAFALVFSRRVELPFYRHLTRRLGLKQG